MDDYMKMGRIVYGSQRLVGELSRLVGLMSGATQTKVQPTPMLLARARYVGEKYFEHMHGGEDVKTKLFGLLETLRELDHCQPALAGRSGTQVDRYLAMYEQAHDALAEIMESLGQEGMLSA